jgi:hypothetical protein
MLEAMNQTTIEAIKLAVVDILGPELAERNQPQLAQVLYNTNNPNAYIYPDETETIRRDRVGEEYIYERRVVVNLAAVQNTLRANGMMDGGAGGNPAVAAVRAEDEPQARAEGATQEPDGQSVTPTAAERRIIASYVARMTYLVYFNEESVPDPFTAKLAVGVANEYLVSNTMEAIDFDQVQRLKSDQAKVYEEQTGQEISLIQWIAQKLNADVYVEIDARSTGETSGAGASARHYGQAGVTIKAFEASTGRLLGTQNWNSPRTTSLASQDEARLNAVQASVYKAMPVVIDQSQAYMVKALENGIKYELVLQNTADTRLMNDFRRRLQQRVRDIRTVSQSAEETRYDVWLIGSMEDLVDYVFDVSEVVEGLGGLQMVLMRSKSATFDTGM